MKNQGVKIVGTAEEWESGLLGKDEAFVEVAPPIDENLMNESLDLQLISIRLQKSLIEDLKAIAKINGLGYQPLMRQVLTRFVNAEKKQILRDRASEVDTPVKQQKIA